MKLRWPGVQDRVLLIRADGAEAYAMRRGGVVQEAAFRNEDIELFKGYCQSRTTSKFTVLVDFVEEDFRVETIPYVAGTARRQLLARKYDQAYRNTPYRTSVSLGREESNTRAPNSKRRDEQVLLMALTNSAAINTWLEVMHAQRAQVRGIHALPAVTGWVNEYLGSAHESALFVTFNHAGLRQVYVNDGKPRFSRLAAFQDETAQQAGPRIAAEITRTEQYLATLRWLPREGEPLRVVLLCPPELRTVWQQVCVNTDRLTYEFPDFAVLARAQGIQAELHTGPDALASSEAPMEADLLWAAGALRFPPKIDFAPDWAHEHYAVWRWRSAIISAGAALCVAGGMAGAVLLAQAKSIDNDADRHTATSTRANANYQAVAKSFPQTGITPEHLRAAVLALDPLAMRPLTPEPMLIQISQALIAAPAFTLSKIDWQVAASADVPASGVVASIRARLGVSGQPGAAAPDRYEIVTITGAVAQDRNATPRRRIAAARSAVDALKRIPGIDVTPVRLPLDVSPTGNLKGGDDDDAASATDADVIVLRISRKVPL